VVQGITYLALGSVWHKWSNKSTSGNYIKQCGTFSGSCHYLQQHHHKCLCSSQSKEYV